MPKPSTPLVLEFRDLTEQQRAKLDDHPASIAPPIQSREDPGRWIVAFSAVEVSPSELFSGINRWARRAGVPTPRRRT
jgi:hypothetical protein